jgi:hypothetical protein
MHNFVRGGSSSKHLYCILQTFQDNTRLVRTVWYRVIVDKKKDVA